MKNQYWAFHTACRLLDVVCLSKSKNIDFRDIRYESVDRRQLFQSFCRSMLNPLWFKGSMDEWMEFAFFLHLMMHRAFDNAVPRLLIAVLLLITNSIVSSLDGVYAFWMHNMQINLECINCPGNALGVVDRRQLFQSFASVVQSSSSLVS
ncbi:hypothetical protein T03_9358, partial [Trichinella britovi]